MSVYTVTRAHFEPSKDGGNHEHIAGVCTEDEMPYMREEVVDSINAGDTWRTQAGDSFATIRPMQYCKHLGCTLSPYITTYVDDAPTDSLDNLPRC